MQLGARIGSEEVIEFQAAARTELCKARQIADRRIKPDVKIFPGRVRNFEAEVGRVARNVPIPKTLREPFIQLAHDALLHRATAHPGVQGLLECTEPEEIMFRIAPDR